VSHHAPRSWRGPSMVRRLISAKVTVGRVATAMKERLDMAISNASHGHLGADQPPQH